MSNPQPRFKKRRRQAVKAAAAAERERCAKIVAEVREEFDKALRQRLSSAIGEFYEFQRLHGVGTLAVESKPKTP